MADAAQDITTTLREARKAAGLSLEEVAAELNIRLRHLDAIESGRFESLPPPAFTAGFVRSYANLLELDGCALARQVREEMGAATQSAELRFPEPVVESRLPGRAALISGLIGLTAIYFGWIHDFADVAEQASPRVDDIPERLAGLTEQASLRTADASLDRDAVRLAPANAVVDRTRETVDSGAAVDSRQQATPTAARVSAMPSPAAVSPQSRLSREIPAPGAHNRIRITAKQDSWMYVADAQGRDQFSGVLRAGESWSPRMGDRARLTLTTTNAGGLRLAVDGEDLSALGEPGGVVRDITLDPERLKNDYTLAMH